MWYLVFLLLLWPGAQLMAQPADDVISVAPQSLTAGAPGALRLALHFPAGYHLNPRAPLLYEVQITGAGLTIAEADRQGQSVAPALPLVIPFQTLEGTHQTTLGLEVTFAYCREDETGLCVLQAVRWQVPVQVSPEARNQEVVVSYEAEVPAVQKP